eukprot:8094403-Lingulodinium_polyedra.AAC.1
MTRRGPPSGSRTTALASDSGRRPWKSALGSLARRPTLRRWGWERCSSTTRRATTSTDTSSR